MGIPADPGSLGQSGSRAGAQNDCEYSQPYGIKPAPERNRKTNWKEFLNRHWEQIVASDFFTVEVWTPKGLKRYIVLFFIELSTRRVDSGRNLEYGE